MGIAPQNGEVIVRIIASPKNWIEGNAVQQLEQTAKLQGMCQAIGMPDLHVGKGAPIGAAFLSRDWFYPYLVGNDIGCGMGWWQTDLKAAKPKLEKWANKLMLDGSWPGDSGKWLEDNGLPGDLWTSTIGTIGGGNHFAELQAVDTIIDAPACNSLNIDKRWLYLLVHSGSRGLGQEILQRHIRRFAAAGLHEDSPEAAAYIREHDQAVTWARANRALIAKRFMSSLRAQGRFLLDVAHNTVTRQIIDDQSYWLHRKGASPSEEGTLVIPGSRGSYSYLVQPVGSQRENAFSLAHGAGRKWNRSRVKEQLIKQFAPEDFRKTELGGLVICEDRNLLYEEAPQAYKDIDRVIADMVEAGLIRVLAILRPVLSYKSRRRRC